VPPATQGQNDAPALSTGGGSIVLIDGALPGAMVLLGNGMGVIPGWVVLGEGTALAPVLGGGAAVARGAWTGPRTALVWRGAGAAAVGALCVMVGLATGTGAGVGLGRGTTVRMIGASLSTGPCARGLLVGREDGIEKSGTLCVCAATTPGTSNTASAAAPLAAFVLAPEPVIDLPMVARDRALALRALNRK
jgi:hypothetical protein